MTPPSITTRVWYVVYGSNLRLERFRCYLAGGRPIGATRSYPGCRNPADPVEIRRHVIGGALSFGGTSSVWGGGMAFYTPAAAGSTAVRAYLVTAEQFADVAAQETRREPGAVAISDIRAVVEGLRPLGSGLYDAVVALGEWEGVPLLTITRSAAGGAPLNPPSRAYLWSVAAGLREAHGWDAEQVAHYLARAPGLEGAWTHDQIAAVAASPEPADEPTVS